MKIQSDLKVFQIISKVLTLLKIYQTKIFRDFQGSSILYGVKRKPGDVGNQQKAF